MAADLFFSVDRVWTTSGAKLEYAMRLIIPHVESADDRQYMTELVDNQINVFSLFDVSRASAHQIIDFLADDFMAEARRSRPPGSIGPWSRTVEVFQELADIARSVRADGIEPESLALDP